MSIVNDEQPSIRRLAHALAVLALAVLVTSGVIAGIVVMAVLLADLVLWLV